MAEPTSGNPMERGQAENFAVLLQELLKRFDERSKRDDDQSKRLADMEETLRAAIPGPTAGPSASRENGDDPAPKRRKRRRTAFNVPDRCRDDVRKMYNVLVQGQNDFDGFDLTESMDSPTNDRMIKTLRSEIVKDHGGEEKCPFSPKEMRDAARRYYRSKKDDRVRREKGKLPAHREKIRKRQRLVQKVERRGRALEKVRDSDSPTWTERHKKRAAEMLDRAYMSSESSGDEDQGGFIVRQLAWESSSLRKLKDSLDKVCPPRGVARVPSAEVSDRQAPEGAPAWAIKRHMRQGERGPSQLDDSLTE
ncbi:uncharacterized protein [Branchiostoma lanceolatum]|uniref:uncharacterized protein n=1 Tax=Branchiostoma lanceolatum TaxID=7740 RepID=UPI003455E610